MGIILDFFRKPLFRVGGTITLPEPPPEVDVRDVPHGAEEVVAPQSLDEYIGQAEAKAILQVEIDSARRVGRPPSHTLLYGPPGVGKTVLAHIIANETDSLLYPATGAEYLTQREVLLSYARIGNWHRTTGKPVVWLIDEIDAIPRTVSYVLHCPVVGTRLLTADLRWIKAEDLRVGDELVGVDEFPRGASRRKLRKSVVTATGRSMDDCVRVVTDKGTLSVNERHPLLLANGRRGRNSERQRWIEAKNLKPGEQVWFVGVPWNTDKTRDGGWLAGLAEGEGSLSPSRGLHVTVGTQERGKAAIIDRAVDALTVRGFSPQVYVEERGRNGWKDCESIRTDGVLESLRYLGSIRPLRLLQVWSNSLLDRGIRLPRKNRWATVERVERIGQQPIVNLATSTKTYIAEGFVSHNTLMTHGYIYFEGEKYGLVPLGIVGTTNHMASVHAALKDRFQVVAKLDYYSAEELGQIAAQAARKMGIRLSAEAAEFIGLNGGGEPRKVTRRILPAVANLLVVSGIVGGGSGEADIKVAERALALSALRPGGLTKSQVDYLKFLEGARDQTAGVGSLAAYLSEPRRDIESEVEPFLIRARAVEITRGGRALTATGKEFLKNIDAYAAP